MDDGGKTRKTPAERTLNSQKYGWEGPYGGVDHIQNISARTMPVMSMFCQSGQHPFELKAATPSQASSRSLNRRHLNRVSTLEYGLRMQEYSLRLRRCYGVVVERVRNLAMFAR